MITQETKIKIKKNEKDYLFYCENASPLGEVYDALAEMRQVILQIMTEREKEKEKEPEPSKEE